VKVIDSSSVAKLVNKEENWQSVEEALRGGCVSLELAVKETGNSLWKRVRRKMLEPKKAERIFQEFVTSIPFRLAEQQDLYAPAFEIAITNGLTIYDALFLALAKAKSMPLVTSDPTQAGIAKKLSLEVELVP
jgi:predicted nucleic acid-binding protein